MSYNRSEQLLILSAKQFCLNSGLKTKVGATKAGQERASLTVFLSQSQSKTCRFAGSPRYNQTQNLASNLQESPWRFALHQLEQVFNRVLSWCQLELGSGVSHRWVTPSQRYVGMDDLHLRQRGRRAQIAVRPEAQLAAVATPPHVQVARRGDRCAVMVSRSDGDDGFAAQAAHGREAPSLECVADAELAEEVVPCMPTALPYTMSAKKISKRSLSTTYQAEKARCHTINTLLLASQVRLAMHDSPEEHTIVRPAHWTRMREWFLPQATWTMRTGALELPRR